MLTTYRREARATPHSPIRPGLHRNGRHHRLPGSIIGPEHLAATTSIGTAAVSGVTTANVAALTAIVIRLSFGQVHRTGGPPPVIAVVPNVQLTRSENHDRAPPTPSGYPNFPDLQRSLIRGRSSRHARVTNAAAPARQSGWCPPPGDVWNNRIRNPLTAAFRADYNYRLSPAAVLPRTLRVFRGF